MCQGILECEVLVGTRSAEGIMASGHVNRIKRPNTWLHRPMLQNREESSCQTGAVHTWHFSDVPGRPDDVRSRGKTGSGLPTAKMTRLTPMYGPAVRCKWFRRAGGERSCINVSGL
jgi:hypothetical protein